MFEGAGLYGTEKVFKPGVRRRLNLFAVCVNLFLPWILFSAIYGTMSFQVHYTRPHLAMASILGGLLVTALAVFFAYRAKARDADPMWFTFAGLVFFLATLLAGFFGNLNYMHNMQPFYDMDNLNTYWHVNPAQRKGQELMDAGKIKFADGVHLDMSKSIGFKNEFLYCVTPITFGNDQLPAYDFWAVGVDCCNGVGNFHCGEFDNPHAKAGLRLMVDEQRPLFRLAVQLAEAQYNIRSQHPLFFEWMQDPTAKLDTFRDDGFHYFVMGMVCHFFFNAICVCAAVCGYSRIRSYGYY